VLDMLRNLDPVAPERAEVAEQPPHVKPPESGNDALAEPLSQRELEVLELINQGLANKEIATRMTVAPATVKAHIRNLYGKLGVSRRTEALARARELGLLD
jgi:LuxR family maltose regulon positive regulatory protein